MERPHECDEMLFRLMEDCWQWEPCKRPNFAMIHQATENILEAVKAKRDQLQFRPHQRSKSLGQEDDDSGCNKSSTISSSGSSSFRSRSPTNKENLPPPPPPKRR